MARRPVSMRKTKEILRLKHELGLTNRQIGNWLCLNRNFAPPTPTDQSTHTK